MATSLQSVVAKICVDVQMKKAMPGIYSNVTLRVLNMALLWLY